MADSLKQKTNMVRLSMYVKRREGMNIDEFNEYWTNTHAPKVSKWLAKYGVIRYTQVSRLPKLRTVVRKLKHQVPFPSFCDGLSISNLATDGADPKARLRWSS